MPASADYLTQLFALEGDVAFITGGGGASGLTTGHILAVDGGWLAWSLCERGHRDRNRA